MTSYFHKDKRTREEIIDDLLLEIVRHIEDRDNLDIYHGDRELVDTIDEFKDYYYKQGEYSDE